MKHELTFTLKPYMYSHTALQQFNLTKQHVLDILRSYQRVTVVTELTSTNNIHYHCLIDIEGIVEKDILLNKIRPYKQLGKPHLQAVQYEESYEKYLQKDVIETTKIINADPVLRDDYNVFNRKKVNIIVAKEASIRAPEPAADKFFRVGGMRTYKSVIPDLEYGIDKMDQMVRP